MGLTQYHGSIYWSWLMAFSAKIACQQQDLAECSRLSNLLTHMMQRDGTVYEIYHSATLWPWSARFYRSESPFSWGASYILDLAHSIPEKACDQ